MVTDVGPASAFLLGPSDGPRLLGLGEGIPLLRMVESLEGFTESSGLTVTLGTLLGPRLTHGASNESLDCLSVGLWDGTTFLGILSTGRLEGSELACVLGFAMEL